MISYKKEQKTITESVNVCNLCVSMKNKEVESMDNAKIQKRKAITMKCPECLNFMTAYIHDNGGLKGNCSVCKATVFTKQHSDNEKLIRIIKH